MSNGNNPADPNNYVRGAKVEPGSLNASHIAPNSIATPAVQAAAIDYSKLANDVVERLVPPGSIMAFGSGNVPAGWLFCDGSVWPRETFPRLFAAIGTTWGAGDFSGNNFQLPDLRGEFLRGIDAGTHRDPDVGTRVKTLGGNPGDAVGSYQWHQLAYHSHPIQTSGGVLEQRGGASAPGWDNPGAYFSPIGYSTITALPTGGNETRPLNASVLFIIKY